MVLKLSLSTMRWLGQKQWSQVIMNWNFWDYEPKELSSLLSSLPWVFCQSFSKLTDMGSNDTGEIISCQETLSQAEFAPQLRLCSWQPGSLVGPQKREHCQHWEDTQQLLPWDLKGGIRVILAQGWFFLYCSKQHHNQKKYISLMFSWSLIEPSKVF